MEDSFFSCVMDVRDSDVDFQSIVANHWYQAYMGHANNRMKIRINCDLQFKGSFQTIFINEIIRGSDNALVATGKWFGCVVGKKEEGPVEPIGLKEARERYLLAKSGK